MGVRMSARCASHTPGERVVPLRVPQSPYEDRLIIEQVLQLYCGTVDVDFTQKAVATEYFTRWFQKSPSYDDFLRQKLSPLMEASPKFASRWRKVRVPCVTPLPVPLISVLVPYFLRHSLSFKEGILSCATPVFLSSPCVWTVGKKCWCCVSWTRSSLSCSRASFFFSLSLPQHEEFMFLGWGFSCSVYVRLFPPFLWDFVCVCMGRIPCPLFHTVGSLALSSPVLAAWNVVTHSGEVFSLVVSTPLVVSGVVVRKPDGGWQARLDCAVGSGQSQHLP